MNENDAYIFEVEEPTQWIFTGGPVWISGWFVSKAGAVFSDIRAVIDGVAHLGILGLPRKDIELRHRGYFGLPHAGFCLRVQPPRGAKLLRLELLDAGHHWVEIWRTGLEVRQGPRPGAQWQTGLIPAQIGRLLQVCRSRPPVEWPREADRLAREIAAVPLDTLPNPPFFGALENPLAAGGSQFGKLRVEGWIIHQEQRIKRLYASTHPLVENVMDYGDRPRAEAGALFPQHPYAARSQFFGMADIDEQAPDPVCLKIFAELEDGTRQLVFVRRFQQRSCRQLEKPLPTFSRRTFAQAVRLFVAAGRRQDIRLGSLGDCWRAGRAAYRNFHRDAPAHPGLSEFAAANPYAAWQRTNQLTPHLREALAASAGQLQKEGPGFLLLVDATGCPSEHLQELAASLAQQIYPKWEACFVGPAAPVCADSRCTFAACAHPAELVRTLNAVVHRSRQSHLALIAGSSRLSPDALLEIAEQFAANAALELVYTDEDLMDAGGGRHTPNFKPDWSPALALSGLFPGQLSMIRRDRFVELGSFREAYDRVPWFDVLLRLGDRLTGDQVVHLPVVCHHGRAEVQSAIDPTDPSVEQARQALADAVRRRAWPAEPFLPATAHHRRRRYHQLRWDASILSRLQVTIVIPTRDKLHLLQECIELLDETVDWRYVKLVIVDDHSRDADAVRYLAAIQQRNDLLCTVVRPADRRAPFNYSHLVNLALPHVDTPLLLHLNNDVNALERGWLEEMVGWFVQPDVGIVGAKLLHPEKTLNHTGIVIGPHGGLADTPLARVAEQEVPEVEWHSAAREVSAVTGACLLTRTALYRELGGFDEKDFGVSYNDVDYCLRVRARGQRVIYTPQAQLMHWGSATRGVTFDEAEHIAFVRRYPRYRDPYLSPHLELAGGRLRCRGALAARTDHAGKLRLLLITHNLSLEGAPLFLLDYATYMAQEAGFSLEVLATQDGPLRAAYTALGAQIRIVDSRLLYASEDEPMFRDRLADLAGQVDWDQVDVVVCNTLVSFWGVHLARLAGKPSLFYVHESASIFRFFERSLELGLHQLVRAALQQATRVLFLCAASQAYYEDENRHGNFRIVPSWIRIDAIEEFRRRHSRAELRRKHGFRDDEVVIANIGTVCERKGQHVFIRAIDHFKHHNRGRGPFRFVMVGARPGIYLDLLKGDMDQFGLSHEMLVPETPDAFDFFLLADLFVCTSYEESFPRVVLEAMAFRTPIVSTDVHGIAEMVRQRAEAYLVKPGDVEGLSRMMRTCLAKERSGKSLTPTAYSKALRYYDYAKVLPLHVELAREAYLAPPP